MNKKDLKYVVDDRWLYVMIGKLKSIKEVNNEKDNRNVGTRSSD